ncbi:MAG: helix-turn-helix domain-containing protein [Roseiarcus sp.]|jgi:DNA-binding HxlR family transcriptional regulator
MAFTLRRDLAAKISAGELHCEKELTMSIISGKYKVVVIWHLGHERPMRYAELHRLFKEISDRILTKQLSELEQDGVVARTVYAGSRPKVEYRLTDLGMSLVPIVDAIYAWGCQHLDFYLERDKVRAA